MIVDRMRAFNLRELRAHPGRTAMSLVVVGISATLLVAVLGIAGSITGSSDRLVAGIGGNASSGGLGRHRHRLPRGGANRRGERARCRRRRADASDVGRKAVRACPVARRRRQRQGHAERPAASGARPDRPPRHAARQGRGRSRHGVRPGRLVVGGQRQGHRRGRHRRCRCRTDQRRELHRGTTSVDSTPDGSGRA